MIDPNRFSRQFPITGAVLILLLTTTPLAHAQLELRTAFADTLLLDYRTDEIFVVWWDKNFDHFDDAGAVLDTMSTVRAKSLAHGLMDPPNPAAGYYYNIYLHHGVDDVFPSGWGNGQGTDTFGMPFLTLPFNYLVRENLYHEGFHVFQYDANSPGFAYSGDSGWFIEASASWFAVANAPTLPVDAFLGASAIWASPHVAMWRSWDNGPPGDPDNWQRLVHQYAMSDFLYFMTDFRGVSPSVVTSGFYSNLTVSPQEYMFSELGGPTMREYFADWAAHNSAYYDYITREQWERALVELDGVGDSTDIHNVVATFTDAGTNGEWFAPVDSLFPRGWAYNVIKIENSATTNYLFTLDGETTGAEGAPAHFEGRVVVMRDGAATYYNLEKTNAQDGRAVVTVSPEDTEIFFVVAAVPEFFGSYQNYPYRVMIDVGQGVSVDEITPDVTVLDFDVHPNPTGDGRIRLQFKVQQEASRLEVLDLLGRKIQTHIVSGTSESLEIQAPSGVYFLRVTDADGKQAMRKVIHR